MAGAGQPVEGPLEGRAEVEESMDIKDKAVVEALAAEDAAEEEGNTEETPDEIEKFIAEMEKGQEL